MLKPLPNLDDAVSMARLGRLHALRNARLDAVHLLRNACTSLNADPDNVIAIEDAEAAIKRLRELTGKEV
jgi:hypothetical protein